MLNAIVVIVEGSHSSMFQSPSFSRDAKQRGARIYAVAFLGQQRI